MRALRDLLDTWENWSARNTLTRALNSVSTDDARDALRRGIDDIPEVGPLDALRDGTELVALLTGWQWQAVHAARIAGASWEEIAAATGSTAEQARTDQLTAIERQERHRSWRADRYHAAL